MSSVGLMMLQEPRVKAPGPRKRRSIFSRPQAMSATSRAAPPPPKIPEGIEEEHSSVNRPVTQPSERPTTTSSDRPATSLAGGILTRKKTEGSDKSSSRNSLFGGRKNSIGDSSIKSGTSSHTSHSQASGAVSNKSREPGRIEEEHVEQVRQQPIALKFQVKHGQKKGRQRAGSTSADRADSRDGSRLGENLSRSDNVSVVSYETESSLTATSSRPISPQVEVSIEPPSLPAAARISAFDDAIFKRVATQLEPEPDAVREPPKVPPRDPKRFSTFGSRHHQLAREEPVSETPAAELDAPHGYSEAESEYNPAEHDRSAGVTAPDGPVEYVRIALPAPQQADSSLLQSKELPEKPRDQSRERRAPLALETVVEASPAKPNLLSPVEQTLSPNSASHSARSSGASSGKAPALSFSGEVRESAIFSDSTWEDDIDYVYEQQAEATCDFDWDFAPRSREQSVQFDGDVLPYDGPFHAHSPSLAGGESNRSSRVSNAGSATERRVTPRTDQAPRISVGHRGFQAARNSSIPSDLSAKGGLTPLHVSRSPVEGGKLSPVFAVAADESPRSPQSPGKLQFPVPPLGRISIDNLSDPESCRDSSKHRKSSSYSSYDSFARTSTAPTSATASTRETGRWSVASGSSAPGFGATRPKRTPSVTKNMISSPLETLPSNMESPTSPQDNSSFPHTVYPDPERDSFVMRRPRTSGDRKVLQAAGRAVQTYRPAAPNGTMRAVYTPDASVNDLSSVAGPDWI